MTTFGVTPEGFAKKTLDDILSEIESDQRDGISKTLNLLSTNAFGQLNGIFGDKLRELWDVAEAVYRSQYPDSANDEALDQVASITGATRLPATRSAVALALNMDDGCSVPSGSIVSIGASGSRFRTTQSMTNLTGAPGTFSVNAESEDYGPIQGLAGTIDTIVTPISGWSAAAALTCGNGQPYALVDAQTLEVEVDGASPQTVTFHSGDFSDIAHATALEVAAVIDGALSEATSFAALGKVRIKSELEGTGSSIQVVGGSANTALGFSTDIVKGFNALDAVVGREVETNPDFRVRRVELLRVTGAGSLEAMRSRIRELDDVIQAFIFENVTMLTDMGGLPPKSFEAVVAGGDDQEIANCIWQVKPAGIQAYGAVTKTVADSMGFNHDISFSRPNLLPIWQALTVVTDPTLFPIDGEDQIKAALKAFGDSMQIGDDVIALQFRCVPLSVAGVIDVTAFAIDIVNPPVNTGNIVVAFRDLATFDTSRISVSVT